MPGKAASGFHDTGLGKRSTGKTMMQIGTVPGKGLREWTQGKGETVWSQKRTRLSGSGKQLKAKSSFRTLKVWGAQMECGQLRGRWTTSKG